MHQRWPRDLKEAAVAKVGYRHLTDFTLGLVRDALDPPAYPSTSLQRLARGVSRVFLEFDVPRPLLRQLGERAGALGLTVEEYLAQAVTRVIRRQALGLGRCERCGERIYEVRGGAA